MERKERILLIGLIIAILVGPTIAYQFGRNSLLPALEDIENQRKKLEQELLRTQEEKKALEQRIQLLEQQKKELEAIKQELAGAKEEVELLQQKLQEVQDEKQKLAEELIQKQQQIETLKQKWKGAELAIFLPLPREVNQSAYFQHVEKTTLSFDVEPSGIQSLIDESEKSGNNKYIVAYWNETHKEVTVSIEFIVYRKVNTNILTSTPPHPYPIPEDLISDNVKPYLEPSFASELNDPNITALAKELSEGLDDESKVVERTIFWVYQNIEPTPDSKIREEYYDTIVKKYGFFIWTAVEVLKHRKAACSGFASLTMALLRAQGIPVRSVVGAIVNFDPSAPPREISGVSQIHMWIQVYYPKIGWVNYDPTFGEVHLPNRIEFLVGHRYGSAVYDPTFTNVTINWYMLGLGNNRVKIRYTVIANSKKP